MGPGGIRVGLPRGLTLDLELEKAEEGAFSWAEVLAKFLLSTLGRLLTCPSGYGFRSDQFKPILRKPDACQAEFIKPRNEHVATRITRGHLPDSCKS